MAEREDAVHLAVGQEDRRAARAHQIEGAEFFCQFRLLFQCQNHSLSLIQTQSPPNLIRLLSNPSQESLL